MEALQSLLKFPPWVRQVELLAEQADRRESLASKPLQTFDGVLVQNYEKGIVAGIRLAINNPATTMELLREEWQQKLQERTADGTE